jgi:hypothetical protein
MRQLIRPDHSEGTGQPAKPAAGALLYVEGRALSVFVESASEAGHGAGRFLAVVAEDRNRGMIPGHVHIDVTFSAVNALAGHLAGPASNASADVNVNRHSVPPGNLAG